MDESRLALIAQRQHKYGYTKNADYDYDSYDSEDDEEEDEVGELITPEVDGQIMKTIGLIRAQDPKIYEATSHFFIPSEMEKARKQWKEKQAEEKKNKPMNLQDYHRKVLMEDGGIVDEEEEDKKIKDESEMTHVEQQEYLKREMKNAFMAGDDDDEGNEDADSFFTQKAKTKEDEEAEEEDYKRFLMESMGSKKGGAEAFQDWREYKNGPKMDKDEAFLMDYILNRGWIDKSQKKTPHYKEIVREEDFDELEKSEDELDAAEEFESKYNFRFEEAEGNSLTGYTRTIDDSVRNKDDKRKRQRTAAKERKKEEKTRQLEDLKRAKNVKKQEIFNKLKQIQEITGNKTVGFDEIDLETDFNPEDYDQKMESMFSDKYYDGDENEKPVFDDDIDTADYEAEDDNDNGSSSAEGGDGDDDEEQAETNDVMMDADYLPGGENYGKPAKKETKKERAQREKEEKKQAKLALSQDKKKDFNSYLDEYYQLDYEDMVGDLPTRFKYHKVKSSAFGLTPVEILLADDKDLNEFVSLKKFAPYRRTDEQEADIQKYSKKNRVQMFRHKLKSQIKDQELDKDWDPVKRRKKELEKREREEKAALEAKEEEEGDGEEKKKSKKKNKEKKRKAEAEEKVSSSKDSLEEEGERKKKKKGDSEDGNDDSKKKTKSKKKEDK
ncbi:KRI1-like family C-terminal-domain-containing protein [Dissophora ornata]|nr:KRI1-like family C-terminal-domain-containing protein [Dissophora ornata]